MCRSSGFGYRNVAVCGIEVSGKGGGKTMGKDKNLSRETKGRPSKSIKEKQAAKKAKQAAKASQGTTLA